LERRCVTAKHVYAWVAALAVLLAFSIAVPFLLPREMSEGLHSPVGLVFALPFFGMFCIGALILTIGVVRSSKLAALPTVIGLMPVAVALLIVLLLVLLAAV
jgi:hypothetical protein